MHCWEQAVGKFKPKSRNALTLPCPFGGCIVAAPTAPASGTPAWKTVVCLVPISELLLEGVPPEPELLLENKPESPRKSLLPTIYLALLLLVLYMLFARTSFLGQNANDLSGAGHVIGAQHGNLIANAEPATETRDREGGHSWARVRPKYPKTFTLPYHN